MINKILHILPDDKFTDYAVNEFNVLPDLNEYVVIIFNSLSPYYVNRDVKVIIYGSTVYYDFLNDVKYYKAIIFHSLLSYWIEEVFSCLPSYVKVGWVFWGREVYGRKELAHKFLGERTTWLFYRQTIKRITEKAFRFRFLKTSNQSVSTELPVSVFRRVNFCITDIEEDYEFAQKVLKCNFVYLWYNYYSIEDMLGALKGNAITGNNILLGNSMTLSNNHLEAFEVLAKFSLSGRKVITPLSYGELEYRERIVNAGYRKLRNHFVPLIEFLPLGEYNELILSCSICVMNHYRHQAFGNTLSALWFGAKTYLSKRSTTYRHLKRLGIVLYSVEDDLLPSNPEALEPLSVEFVALNKRILLKEYGKENILFHTRQLINLMIK